MYPIKIIIRQKTTLDADSFLAALGIDGEEFENLTIRNPFGGNGWSARRTNGASCIGS